MNSSYAPFPYVQPLPKGFAAALRPRDRVKWNRIRLSVAREFRIGRTILARSREKKKIDRDTLEFSLGFSNLEPCFFPLEI